MTASNTCPRCGSTNLEPGDLLDGEGKVRFRPINRRFFTLRSSAVVAAFVCMDCGSVQMSVDVEDVAGMLKQEHDQELSPENSSSAEPIECLECGAKIE